MKENLFTTNFENSFVESFEKHKLVESYINKDFEKFNELLLKYPEFKKIDIFIKIAEAAFENFKDSKYCTFNIDEDDFFSLIDCTFKGYSPILYITSENEDICDYPLINYDHSCMLYIEIPEDFNENSNKYKKNFIIDTIIAVYENYITVLDEDAKGLTGKTLPNPNYIGED